MALNERHFAEILVALRAQQATGVEDMPIGDGIAIAQTALDELQQSRAAISQMANLLEAATAP
jgi:hypothetical protein